MQYFSKSSSVIHNFANFITNENIINASIGFYLATNMKSFISSLSKNIITPILNINIFKLDEKKMFTVLKNGKTKTIYNNVNEAREDNAIFINYGDFINSTIELLISYITLFIIIYIIYKIK